MQIPVLVHPGYKGRPALEEAIGIVNQIQPYFRLSVDDAGWLSNSRQSKIDAEVLTKRVQNKYKMRPVIPVIQTPLKKGWFDHASRGICVVSTAGWDEHFAPPPLKVYLVFQFACALARFVADLPDEQIDSMSHNKLRGCVFDYTEGRREFRLDLVAAHLCAECEARLSEWGVLDKPIDAIVEILAYVRAFAIRRPRSTPSFIFIGHGRHKDWERLRDFLEGTNLKVDEFNVDPTAGVTTVERLTEMLNRACFALLVMTAEDRQVDGTVQARQNVVHEIGLFQGKLGFRKSIVVMQKGVAKFSNIEGLTYISYPKGKIQAAFPLIAEVLIREGVLDPSLGVRPKGRKVAVKKALPKRAF